MQMRIARDQQLLERGVGGVRCVLLVSMLYIVMYICQKCAEEGSGFNGIHDSFV